MARSQEMQVMAADKLPLPLAGTRLTTLILGMALEATKRSLSSSILRCMPALSNVP